MFLAFSLNSNFFIFPVDVLGSSPITTNLGHLKFAKYFLQKLIISVWVVFFPSLSSTNAQGTSPHFSSGLDTTAAANILGFLYNVSSTSIEEIFSPPDMIMSFDLSLSSI